MTAMIAPVFARVLIQRDKIKTNIIIPTDAAKRNAPITGTVLATGPTADNSIKKGDRIIFGRHAGTWLEGIDDDLYLLQDEDVLAVLA